MPLYSVFTRCVQLERKKVGESGGSGGEGKKRKGRRILYSCESGIKFVSAPAPCLDVGFAIEGRNMKSSNQLCAVRNSQGRNSLLGSSYVSFESCFHPLFDASDLRLLHGIGRSRQRLTHSPCLHCYGSRCGCRHHLDGRTTSLTDFSRHAV